MGYIVAILLLIGLPAALFIAVFTKLRALSERIVHLEAQLRAATSQGMSEKAPTVGVPQPSTMSVDSDTLERRPPVVPPPSASSPYARNAATAWAAANTPKHEPVSADATAQEPLSADSQNVTSAQQSPYTRRSTKERTSKARTSKEWEMLVGGKILNRIGSIAVLLGVVFFMKYAFDNNWITPAMRCIIGGVAGLSLIALGERTRKKGLAVFTQGLVGVGIPILYFSLYAAYNFYHLMPQAVAFILMVGVTTLSLALALRHTSLFLAIASAVFGMLVPAMLPSGVINTAALHTYILLLDVGLAAMVIGTRKWRIVLSIAATGTWAWWGVWFVGVPYEQLVADRPLALALLASAGIVFSLADLACLRFGIHFEKVLERGLSTLSMLIWLNCISSLSYPAEVPHQITVMLVAAWFFFCTWLAQRNEQRAAMSQYAALTILAVVWSVALDSDFESVIVGFGATAALAATMLRRSELRLPTVLCIIIVSMTTLVVCVPYVFSSDDAYVLIFNKRLFSFVGIAAATWWTAVQVGNYKTWSLRTTAWILRLSAYLLLFVAVHEEILEYFISPVSELTSVAANQYANYTAGTVASASVVLVAALVLSALRRMRMTPAHIAALITLGVGTVIWLTTSFNYLPDHYYTAVLNLRVLTGCVVLAGLILAYVLDKKARNTADKHDVQVSYAQRWLSGLALLLVTFQLCSLEAVWTTVITLRASEQAGEYYVSSARIQDLWNRFHLILSGTWIAYSALLMILGFIRRIPTVRITAIALLGVSIVKVFLYDLSFLGQPYRIVSFIALGLILLAASYIYVRFKHIIMGTTERAEVPEAEPLGVGADTEPPIEN